jgi:outer membrane protein TolC
MPRQTLTVLLLAVILVVSACSTAHYKQKADEVAYGLIEARAPDVPGMPGSFTIEEEEVDFLEGLPIVTEVDEFFIEPQSVLEELDIVPPSTTTSDEATGTNALMLGTTSSMRTRLDYSDKERGATIISLEKALDIAFQNNRSFQARQESLYLSALQLDLQRNRFRPIFSGGGDVTVEGFAVEESVSSGGTKALVDDLDGLTGNSRALFESYSDLVNAAGPAAGVKGLKGDTSTDLNHEQSLSGSGNIGVNLLLAGGAQIAVDLTSNFFRFLTGDPEHSSSTLLSATINQPLLRGAGRKVVLENLTQAERDFLYDLRDFTRFRKEFAVDTASSYYAVLQARDSVRNNWLGYRSFQRSADELRAKAAAGRIAVGEVRRTEQEELTSRSTWTRGVQNYESQLDEFKIFLGFTTDARIVLDNAELVELMAQVEEAGLNHPQISAEDAAAIALASRLDLMNTRDQREDAGRRIVVAENALKADLDLILTGNVDSDDGNYTDLDWKRARWSAGLGVDLPLERTAERNSYASALIADVQAARNLELAEDRTKLDVRERLRGLDQAKIDYEVSRIGVELNERRVEEQDIKAAAGIGRPIDLNDAQNDLTDARNQLTRALVTHTISRLEFWRDMGILFIKEDGQWDELSEAPSS